MTIVASADKLQADRGYGYNGRIHELRATEYAHLGGNKPSLFGTDITDTIYLDHAGATPYPISIVRDHCKDLCATLLSNPHSRSPSSIATAERITQIRHLVLEFFNADPENFDIVFVANATAGIKLVADGFAGSVDGFRYNYLRDAHTSLVGVTGMARESKCLSEEEIKVWLGSTEKESLMKGLFAFPAQSNFNGRRFPLAWLKQLRDKKNGWFSLLDAASFLTTTPLDLSDPASAPDFTVLSFYKIFGYPDLGAVIVRRDAAHVLQRRLYFGGGTRATLTADGSHKAPHKALHESLEDGTLPFHHVLALESAFSNYSRLFGRQLNVARHSAAVTRLAYTLLSSLRHANGQRVCMIYSPWNHGPIIAFNLLTATSEPMGFISFEKEASSRGFAVRTGGMCNPGGVQHYLDLPNNELAKIFEQGKVCGDAIEVVNGKLLGVIRGGFGACSTFEDVVEFVNFVREFSAAIYRK